MRASRETELAQDGFPIHTVTAWLGNTPRIALKHYLTVTDDDFDRATGRSAKRSAAPTGTQSHRAARNDTTPWRAKGLCESLPEGAAWCDTLK